MNTAYVLENKYLPDVPSAEDVKNEGIDLAGMDAKLLKKIKELKLYAIEQQKQNAQMQSQIQ